MHVLRDFFLLQIRLRADTRLYIRVALQKPIADNFLLLPNYCKAAEKLLDIIIIIVLWLFLFLFLYLVVVVGILRVVQLILLLGGRK